MDYQEPSDQVTSYRISDALCKENWTAEEINSLMEDSGISQKLDWIEENLWYPKPMELFNFIFQTKLTPELEDDIHYHLETLGCARTIRLMKTMVQDPGMNLLKKLPAARLMNIFSHLAFSKTWIVSLHPTEKTTPQTSETQTLLHNPSNNSLPIKQMKGDSSKNIILGNFPIRMKRSMQPNGERITLLFPNRTYPFPKVRVMAINENYETVLDGEFALDAGSKFWSVRFKAPIASKYMLLVRPVDASECFAENTPILN